MRGCARALAFALMLSTALPLPAQAATAVLRGTEMNGFGRAVFSFDALPKATARISNGILILAFDKPVTVSIDKITTELPSYVSAARLDPDGKGLRMALTRPLRSNLMEAGEKLFLDLLPETWKAPPPPLPQDVVDDLSRRAREAEETARRLTRKKASEEARELGFRVGTTPTFTRVVFEMPVVAPVEFRRDEDTAELVFDSNLRLDVARLRAALPQSVQAVEATNDAGTYRLTFTIPADIKVTGFREDESFAIDIATPKPAPRTAGAPDPKAKAGDPKPGEPKPADAKPADTRTAEARPGDPMPAEPRPAGARTPEPRTPEPRTRESRPAGALPEPSPEVGARALVDARETARPEAASPSAAPMPPPSAPTTPAAPTPVVRTTAPPAAPPMAPAKAEDAFAAADEKNDVKVGVSAERGSIRLTLPISPRTPVAVFERAGTLWIAAETKAGFDPSQIGLVAPGAVGQAETRRVGRLSILRLALNKPALVRAAVADTGWVVTLGDDIAAASAPLTFYRDADIDGRTVVKSAFKDVAGVHWVDDPDIGDKIAIVTGRDTVHSLVKPVSFVDFRALATAHGLAITPVSDDLVVKTGIDEVAITKDGGLAVSLLTEEGGPPVAAPKQKLAIDRAQWANDRAGNIRERGREMMRAAADAPKRLRTEARVAVGRFNIANGLEMEGIGTLAVAMAEDPDTTREKPFQVLYGAAHALAGRVPEAAKILGADPLKDDPEAQLWRAYTDALQRRWPQALANFRRSGSVLSGYPDDLQGKIGPSYAEAAIETRDFGLAQRLVETLDALDSENVDKQRLRLLSARIAEGQGRVDEAAAAYDSLTKTANRPIEARARLYRVMLALKDRSIERKAAIGELEALTVAWRGDEVEAKALGQLGRLYAEENRWRDAFTMARRANELFPDNDETRTLYEEAGSRFEALFLDNKADQIPRLDALALYFDFKEFTPPGRRGDEMIRRLAERLIGLDLLAEAADLLQYQVDNRLSGAAKATVASRLAVIYLMNRQPAKAYQALRDSRLAELPSDVKRSRALLEARALSDLSRSDLALELIAAEQGPEIERLRADILWQGRRWREAGEQFERIAGDSWKATEPLDERQRADVMRAAIAYGLADDTLSLERLRAKFSAKMADSFDNRAFAVVTSPSGARAAEYRELAKSIASADTLSEFLTEYRKRYPDTPQAPKKETPAAAAPATPAAPAQGAQSTPPAAGEAPRQG